jgi:hypothetical protein
MTEEGDIKNKKNKRCMHIPIQKASFRINEVP